MISSVEKATERKITQLKTKYAKQMQATRGDVLKMQQQKDALSSEMREVNMQAQLARAALTEESISSQRDLARAMAKIATRSEKLLRIRNKQKTIGAIKSALKNVALGAAAATGITAATRYGLGRGSSAIQEVQSAVSE
jgi:hypothetical protein